MSDGGVVAKILIDFSEYSRLKRAEKELIKLQSEGNTCKSNAGDKDEKEESSDAEQSCKLREPEKSIKDQTGSGTVELKEQVRQIVEDEVKKSLRNNKQETARRRKNKPRRI